MREEIQAVQVVAMTAADEARRLPEHSQIRRFLIRVGLELDGLSGRLNREGTEAPIRAEDRVLGGLG